MDDDKCVKCSMPVEEGKTRCKCSGEGDSKCVHCCECPEGCECDCVKKSADLQV
jgi:hypothetical protein